MTPKKKPTFKQKMTVLIIATVIFTILIISQQDPSNGSVAYQLLK